jgi:hypothetical protein
MFSLYVDGANEDSAAFTGSLSQLTDINNWLGRSQFSQDPGFGGTIDEFRVYSAPLSGDQVALSLAAGPNPDFLDP